MKRPIHKTADNAKIEENADNRQALANSTATNRMAETNASLQPTATPGSQPIVFFDGVCGLCNRFVDFVLRRDPDGILRFSPLQGETAAQLLPESDVRNLNSMVLLDAAGTSHRSSAVVRVLHHLGGFWRVLGTLLWVIPTPLRNLGYSGVARVRYWVFGKHDTCRLPTPEERSRFLP